MDRCRKTAYLREENEVIEIDHPLERVWQATQKTLTNLQWNIEQVDESSHQIKAKTQAGFMSYSSLLIIQISGLGENKTKMSVHGETAVTTITSIVDFGQTRRRMDIFFQELANQLSSQQTSSDPV